MIGVEPELASDAAQSLKAGSIVSFTGDQTGRTAADGLRTQSVGALNFAHMQAYVDDIVTVTEAEIREAMRRMIFATRLVPEPSGAVALAAALFHRKQLPCARETVAIMSGGNVEPAVLRSVLEEFGSHLALSAKGESDRAGSGTELGFAFAKRRWGTRLQFR